MNKTTVAIALCALFTIANAQAQSRAGVSDPNAPLKYVDRAGNTIAVDFNGTALLPKGSGEFVTATFCGSAAAGWSLGCSPLVYFDSDCKGQAWMGFPTRSVGPGLIATAVVQRQDGIHIYESVGDTPGVSTFQYIESYNADAGTRTCDVNEDYLYVWPARDSTRMNLLPPYNLR
ncbi:MAG TPA: hypothetical protein VFC24_02705 [Casimicrobiaceae bacterium]|nr:hypothetical protein [Casimicrobiaceae bacterium]